MASLSRADHQMPSPWKRAVSILRLTATNKTPRPKEMDMDALGYSTAVKNPPIIMLNPQRRKE